MMAPFERFNLLEYEAQAEDIFTLSLEVDVRDTVAERLGIAAASLLLCVFHRKHLLLLLYTIECKDESD